MKELTKAEEQVMQCIWKLKKAFLKDIVAEYPDPKPAYTTISTLIRILVKKEFIGFKTYGKANEYFPRISKDAYSKASLRGMMQKYFNNSPTLFTSFFAKNESLSVEELEAIRAIIDAEIQKKRK